MPIDMHAHWIPEALSAALRARAAPPLIRRGPDGEYIKYQGGDIPLRDGFDKVERRLESMDRHGVSRGVLSLTTVFGIECLPVDEAVPLARLFNDGVSRMCVDHPDRFSGLAALPVADVSAAAAEFERANDLPGMAGALLPGDGFLTLERAEAFRPIFEAAQRRRSHILVHYGPMADDPGRIRDDHTDNALERRSTLDMQARLSSNMVTFCLTHFLDDYPDMTVQSHNLGGNIAFEVERMDHLSLDRRPDAPPPSERIRKAPVFVDCNSFGARAIERAVEVYGADKIVLGTDGTNFGMEWSIKALGEARISESDRHGILHGNAELILARAT